MPWRVAGDVASDVAGDVAGDQVMEWEDPSNEPSACRLFVHVIGRDMRCISDVMTGKGI